MNAYLTRHSYRQRRRYLAQVTGWMETAAILALLIVLAVVVL